MTRRRQGNGPPACDPWRVRAVASLVALLVLATACSVGDGPTIVTPTTTPDLFGGVSTTSTLPPAEVPDWEPVQLVAVRKEAEACIAGDAAAALDAMGKAMAVLLSHQKK